MSDQIQELMQPLFFGSRIVGDALDNFDPADPHRRADEFDDDPSQTAPRGNVPFYDTSTSTPIKQSNTSLSELPDYSDEVMTDYRIKQILGHPIDVPTIVDLDTAPNYVGFIKNSIRNILSSENEFSIDSKENGLRDVLAK